MHHCVGIAILAPTVLIASSLGASGQAPFTEEAVARGVNLVTFGGNYEFGRGLGLVDLDGDGDLDLVLTGAITGFIGVFENDGTGFFIDRTMTSGMHASIRWSGIVSGDFDGDGDLDLYISNFNEPNALFRNDGNFVFTDVAATAGVDHSGETVGCAAGDYDGDGWLDLFVVDHDPLLVDTSRLYRNLGGINFEDVTILEGVTENGPSFQAVFFDTDLDGDSDLYLTNDKGPSLGFNCRHWRNDSGSFTDISASSGAGVFAEGMGCGLGDINRDGWLDLYVTNTQFGGSNLLFLNDGTGGFIEASNSYGVAPILTGWGAPIFDFDNDGFEDIYACDGGGPNHLYRGSETLPLIDLAPALGVVGAGPTFCATAGDIDGDGDVDLVVQATNAPIEIFINNEGSQRNWIEFRLESSTPNTTAVGATVEVRTGSTWQIRPIRGGGSYKDSPPHTAHFGLDQATQVDEVRVRWPGGAISTHGPFNADQRLSLDDSTTVLPVGNMIRGDANGDLAFDVADPITVLQFLFSSQGVACEAALDANADAAIDVSDPIYTLSALFSFGLPPTAPFPNCGPVPVAGPACATPSCP